MKIFNVEFKPMYPVGCCLLIAAETIEEATEIAKEELAGTKLISIEEIGIDKPKVLIFMDGDY